MPNRLEKSKDALGVSQQFEGSDTNANITGNFDGVGLTCGALGWTIKWENQDPLVNAFIQRHGLDRAKELMPEVWDEYLAVIRASGQTAIDMSAKWSGTSSTVKEPYRSELRAFWKSPEMAAIQQEWADKDMGLYADTQTKAFCALHGIPDSQIVFRWFFDIKVHNGGMKGINLDAGKAVSFGQVASWAKLLDIPSRFANTKKDLVHNISTWERMYDSMTPWQRSLFGLSFLRSQIARKEFHADVMNRKGSVASGVGRVHGHDYDFRKMVLEPITPAPQPETPKDRSIIELGGLVGLPATPLQRMLDWQKQNRPGRSPRFWGAVDFSRHSSKPRLFVIDVKEQKVSSYLVSHGIGSEGKSDDGMADIFSNVPNSKASSLGLYRCDETYFGKHGLSLFIDGLDSTNSKARQRAIVIHGASYVSEKVVKEAGRVGRSEGCFALDEAVKDTVINQLKEGSLLIAFK